MDTSRLFSLIESRSEELYSLLSSLIRYNSESFSTSGNEEAVARYIDGLCRELSLESELYTPLDIPDFKSHPDYMEGRGLENRYNVTARWRGHEDKDELLLMAHSDTVKIGDPANWRDDPLSGRIADGRIYGRGANDDKYATDKKVFLTEDDAVVEFTLNNVYKMYKNLSVRLELAYIINDFGAATEAANGDDDDWYAGLTFDFRF